MKGLAPVLTLATLMLVPGCRPKKANAPVSATAPMPSAAVPAAPPATLANPHAAAMPPQKRPEPVVKPSQKDKWKAAKVTVTEISTGKEVVHLLPLGQEVRLAEVGVTMRVDTILSDFAMAKGIITSGSDELKNPAIQAEVKEAGKSVFKGWLFNRFPDRRTYGDGKYSIKLEELVPAR